jgi:hypothetical protein
MGGSIASTISKNRLSATVLGVSAVAATTSLAWDSAFVDKIKGLFSAAGTVSGLYQAPVPTSALQPCVRGSQNCIRTTWVPPPGTSQKTAMNAIQTCLSSYPQEGQNGIDSSGWDMAEDHLEKTGSARLEFKSSIGKMAKNLNGGKPFIDDLLVAVQEDGRVEVRSSSRKGYSDLGVNQKRLLYLANKLPKTWEVPDPEYQKDEN